MCMEMRDKYGGRGWGCTVIVIGLKNKDAGHDYGASVENHNLRSKANHTVITHSPLIGTFQ